MLTDFLYILMASAAWTIGWLLIADAIQEWGDR
jgi:hypothetical protein